MMTQTQSQVSMRDVLSDAICYWEPRRIDYNLALAAVVFAWSIAIWPQVRATLNLQLVLALFVLAVLANVCYCAAYLGDVPVQCSSFRTRWRGRRWMLWLLGTLFGMALTYYWIGDEIYPALAH